MCLLARILINVGNDSENQNAEKKNEKLTYFSIIAREKIKLKEGTYLKLLPFDALDQTLHKC